jgi:hypothetical protein
MRAQQLDGAIVWEAELVHTRRACSAISACLLLAGFAASAAVFASSTTAATSFSSPAGICFVSAARARLSSRTARNMRARAGGWGASIACIRSV